MAEIYSCKNIGSLSLKMFLNTSTDLNPVIWLPILLFSTLVIGGEALPHHRLERSISVAEWNKDYNLWQYQWGCYRAISSPSGAKLGVLCAELLSHYWTLTGPNFKVPKKSSKALKSFLGIYVVCAWYIMHKHHIFLECSANNIKTFITSCQITVTVFFYQY